MAAYWADYINLLQRIAQYGKPALIIVEPDFFGFARQTTAQAPYNGDPTKVPAVLSTDPVCAAMAANLTNYAPCVLQLARHYASNAFVGFVPSLWNAPPDPVQTAAWMQQIHAVGDFVPVETLDRDVGCFEQARLDPQNAPADCTGRAVNWRTTYWDESNQTSPDFNDYFTAIAQLDQGLGNLPVMFWQTPFGVPSNTPGGSPGHYRDNRVDYFFKHPQQLVSVGAFAAVFGAGDPDQTTPATDGGQFQRLSLQYLSSPAMLP